MMKRFLCILFFLLPGDLSCGNPFFSWTKIALGIFDKDGNVPSINDWATNNGVRDIFSDFLYLNSLLDGLRIFNDDKLSIKERLSLSSPKPYFDLQILLEEQSLKMQKNENINQNFQHLVLFGYCLFRISSYIDSAAKVETISLDSIFEPISENNLKRYVNYKDPYKNIVLGILKVENNLKKILKKHCYQTSSEDLTKDLKILLDELKNVFPKNDSDNIPAFKAQKLIEQYEEASQKLENNVPFNILIKNILEFDIEDIIEYSGDINLFFKGILKFSIIDMFSHSDQKLFLKQLESLRKEKDRVLDSKNAITFTSQIMNFSQNDKNMFEDHIESLKQLKKVNTLALENGLSDWLKESRDTFKRLEKDRTKKIEELYSNFEKNDNNLLSVENFKQFKGNLKQFIKTKLLEYQAVSELIGYSDNKLIKSIFHTIENTHFKQATVYRKKVKQDLDLLIEDLKILDQNFADCLRTAVEVKNFDVDIDKNINDLNQEVYESFCKKKNENFSKTFSEYKDEYQRAIRYIDHLEKSLKESKYMHFSILKDLIKYGEEDKENKSFLARIWGTLFGPTSSTPTPADSSAISSEQGNKHEKDNEFFKDIHSVLLEYLEDKNKKEFFNKCDMFIQYNEFADFIGELTDHSEILKDSKIDYSKILTKSLLGKNKDEFMKILNTIIVKESSVIEDFKSFKIENGENFKEAIDEFFNKNDLKFLNTNAFKGISDTIKDDLLNKVIIQRAYNTHTTHSINGVQNLINKINPIIKYDRSDIISIFADSKNIFKLDAMRKWIDNILNDSSLFMYDKKLFRKFHNEISENDNNNNWIHNILLGLKQGGLFLYLLQNSKNKDGLFLDESFSFLVKNSFSRLFIDFFEKNDFSVLNEIFIALPVNGKVDLNAFYQLPSMANIVNINKKFLETHEDFLDINSKILHKKSNILEVIKNANTKEINHHNAYLLYVLGDFIQLVQNFTLSEQLSNDELDSLNNVKWLQVLINQLRSNKHNDIWITVLREGWLAFDAKLFLESPKTNPQGLFSLRSTYAFNSYNKLFDLDSLVRKKSFLKTYETVMKINKYQKNQLTYADCNMIEKSEFMDNLKICQQFGFNFENQRLDSIFKFINTFEHVDIFYMFRYPFFTGKYGIISIGMFSDNFLKNILAGVDLFKVNNIDKMSHCKQILRNLTNISIMCTKGIFSFGYSFGLGEYYSSLLLECKICEILFLNILNYQVSLLFRAANRSKYQFVISFSNIIR